MAATLLQTSPTLRTQASGATSTLAYSSNLTAGSLSVLVVTNFPGAITSVSGSTNGAYTKAVGFFDGGNNSVELWYKANVSAGAETLTITPSTTSGNYISARAQEWAGMEATATLDQTGSAGALSVSTAGATSQADELAFTAAVADAGSANCTWGLPAGYTAADAEQDSNNFTGYSWGYRVLSATGTQSVTHTAAVVGDSIIATFKVAATAPSGPVFDSAIFSAPPFDTGVAGPTIVSGSFAGAWSVANIVSTTKAGAFSVRNYATGSQSAAFSVRASVAGSAAGAWSVRNSVAGSQSGAFSVRNYATGSADGAWSVAGGTTIVSGSAGGAWSVRNLASATFSAASSVRNAASATQAGAWSVRAAVSASADGAWSVRNYAAGSLSAAWSVGGPVTAEWSGAWSVEQQASNSTGGGYGGGRRPKRFYTVEVGGKRRIFLDPTEALAALNADTATEAPQPVEAAEKAPPTRKQRKQAAQALKAAPQVVEVPLQPVQEWAALRGMLDQYEAAVEQMRLGELVALVEMMRDEEDVELLLLHA